MISQINNISIIIVMETTDKLDNDTLLYINQISYCFELKHACYIEETLHLHKSMSNHAAIISNKTAICKHDNLIF